MTTPGNLANAGPDGSLPGARQPGRAPARDVLELPEIVIVPAHPVTEGDSRDVMFELREGADGVPVLPVFSSVQRLAGVLGGAQPWVALPLHKIRELAAAGQVRTVMLDPQVQPGAWRWRYGDLANFPGSTE